MNEPLITLRTGPEGSHRRFAGTGGAGKPRDTAGRASALLGLEILRRLIALRNA